MGKKIKEIEEVLPEEFEEEYENVDDEYEYVEEVEEYLSDLDDNTRQRSAVERIEQSNLYLTLLNHQLFAPGSARPEIIQIVETEIKDFILERLEGLLGIAESGPALNKQVSIFSDDQAEALKAIANRLVGKKPIIAPKPQINLVQGTSHAERTYPPALVATPSIPTTPAKTAVKKKVRRKKEKNPVIVIKPPTEEEGNRGSDGKDYSQAVGSSTKPQQMPPQETQNIMNSNAVNAAQGARANGQAGEIGTLLGAAINLAQQNNKHVKEDS